MYAYEIKINENNIQPKATTRQTLQADILLTQNYHTETEEVIILHLSPAINQPKEPKQKVLEFWTDKLQS